MQFSTFTTLACLLGSAFSAAIVDKRCVGEGYATFYNDHACSTGAGTAVSMGNSGCLANEIGRNSIYIQAPCETRNGGPSLVWSPGTNCGCQNDCAKAPTTQGCWDLAGHAAASSFRFIEQSCGANNF